MDMLQTHQFFFNNFQRYIFVLYISQTEIHGFRVIFLREKNNVYQWFTLTRTFNISSNKNREYINLPYKRHTNGVKGMERPQMDTAQK